MARARATDSPALIRAAARVFRAKGYRNTTIDDIADAAKVSRPTVYTYAKSKRWLLDQIVHELLDELRSRLDADLHVGESGYEHLRAVIRSQIEVAVANRTFFWILFSEQTELSPATRKRFRSWGHDMTADFGDLLKACLNENAVRAGLDPTVAANLIVTMLTSIHRWYDPKGPMNLDQLTDQILIVIGGIVEGPLSPGRRRVGKPDED